MYSFNTTSILRGSYYPHLMDECQRYRKVKKLARVHDAINLGNLSADLANFTSGLYRLLHLTKPD